MSPDSRKKIQSFTLGFFSALMFLSMSLTVAYAKEYKDMTDAPLSVIPLEIPIGSVTEINSGFPQYIRELYKFGVSAIGLIATVMIMWGGFKWIVAGGSSGKIGDAKDTIYNALIGLFLALISYTLLNLINPALVNINAGVIKEIEVEGASKSFNDIKKCIDVESGSACADTKCNYTCSYGTNNEICKGVTCSQTDASGDPYVCASDSKTSGKTEYCTTQVCADIVETCLGANDTVAEDDKCLCGEYTDLGDTVCNENLCNVASKGCHWGLNDDEGECLPNQ